MLTYHHPAGVAAGALHERPALVLPKGGRVVIDDEVLRLWSIADGKGLEAIERAWTGDDAGFVRAGLACLAEAGLLERRGTTAPDALDRPVTSGPAVTAVVITHTTQWLEGCLGSLMVQQYQPLDVILVDNDSRDDVPSWCAARFPSVTVLRLPPGRTFAQAVNAGVAAATGPYVAILNPDIELDQHAIGECVRVAEANPRAAAVAAKLMFWWAPAFLNGIGNRVEDRSWGTDNFIGHLDLGQFDALRDVPSVCFAATLVRRRDWEAIGPADEVFPLYYEDAEWSYRARLLGYDIVAAPRAVVRHVFGYKVRGGEESDLTPRKLAMAVYGRLRFVNKLMSGPTRRRYLRRYLTEDLTNVRILASAGHWSSVRAYMRGWLGAVRHLPEIRGAHRRLQRSARLRDVDLFSAQAHMDRGLLWSGVPELSREVIETCYLPLLAGGVGRRVPEMSGVMAGDRQ